MKKLPLDAQTFSEIMESDRLYVDKTEYIHRLITGYNQVFLSRPRRFGKTLLLDTIKEIFSGRRDLFRGLYIEKSTDYGFPKHPVIKLDMSYAESETAEQLKRYIKSSLLEIAHDEELDISEESDEAILIFVLKKLTKKYGGKRVVFLVDECDAPVARNIGQLPMAETEANREVLHGFYESLKNCDEYLRFVFVTGVTRYAVGSSDGEYNILVDISLSSKFSGICGFTSQEIDQYFGDRMQETLEALVEKGDLPPHSAQEDLKRELIEWYGGYNWGSKPEVITHQGIYPQEMNHQVMNPISILNFFKKKEFSDYWFQSGLPANLTKLIQAKPLDYLEPKLDGHNLSSITSVEVYGLKSISALFHSGYLTIDEITLFRSKDGLTLPNYSFKFPNYEVGKHYKRHCLDSIFTTIAHELKNYSKKLLSAFLAKDPKAASFIFQDIL
ncbi:MAG: AAA family ATPase, partial [Deltaproteobacteria bacterium]|nr:AAA family ATPase [Deltaproteobacteria bacterium]